MKKTRITLILTLLSSLLIGMIGITLTTVQPTIAQSYWEGEQCGDTPRSYLMSILTEDQKEVLFDKRQELWESGASRIEIRREIRETLKDLLTEEQREILAEKIQELKECNIKNESTNYLL